MNIQKISSRDNQKLKFAKSIRDGREKTRIFVEGLRLCEETLRANLRIESVFFTQKFSASDRGLSLIETLSQMNVELLEVPEQIFDSLSDTKTSQGIVLICDRPVSDLKNIEQNLSAKPLLILLHQINNPANLGAILRTAEASGINGVIITKGSADVFSAKTMRSALGANLRVPLWINAEYKEVVEWAEQNNIVTICADIRAKKSYLDIDWAVGKMLVVGSEANGLNIEERLMTDESLIIPMENNVESLNVAVATGIILFEAKRQRFKQKK